jgi:hypothetical protein
MEFAQREEDVGSPRSGLPVPVIVQFPVSMYVPYPPIEKIRSKTTVESALRAIIGISPTQKDLLAIRQQIFGSIMPPPTRAEKRQRPLNLDAFERCGATLIPLLSNPNVFREILNVVIRQRNGHLNKEILMSLFAI